MRTCWLESRAIRIAIHLRGVVAVGVLAGVEGSSVHLVWIRHQVGTASSSRTSLVWGVVLMFGTVLAVHRKAVATVRKQIIF